MVDKGHALDSIYTCAGNFSIPRMEMILSLAGKLSQNLVFRHILCNIGWVFEMFNEGF